MPRTFTFLFAAILLLPIGSGEAQWRKKAKSRQTIPPASAEEIRRIVEGDREPQEEWKYVTQSSGGALIYYSPRRTSKSAKGIARTWVKYLETKEDSNESSTVSLMELDCREQMYRTLQRTIWYKSGKGSTITYRAPSWAYITPGDVLEDVLPPVCKR